MEGKLVKRLPIFWGPGRHFLLVDAPDGSRNLLVARWRNDSAAMAIVNSKTLTRTGTGFYGVRGGYPCRRLGLPEPRRQLRHRPDGTGRKVVSAINGTWNRVTVWNAAGEPLRTPSLGRELDAARQSARHGRGGSGRRWPARDHRGHIGGASWSPGSPVAVRSGRALCPARRKVLRHVSASGKPWIIAGTEDGTMILLNGEGDRCGPLLGVRAMLQVVQTAQGPPGAAGDRDGQRGGFPARG